MPDPLLDPLPFWDPTRHADRRPLLLARGRIQSALRAWFVSEGFTEVDVTALQVSPGNEVHLHALATEVRDESGAMRRRYLHTSPEFAMKKLLAAGETRIHSFAPVWRDREGGARHTTEFTMLEWYRAGADYTDLMQDCAAVLTLAAKATGGALFRHGAASCDATAPPLRMSVAEAAQEFAGVDLLATLDDAGFGQTSALAAAMRAAGIDALPDGDWSDLFSVLLMSKIEPHLGRGRPTILDRYPACEAALARRAPDDPRVAERFELYACGVELANGFGELTDPKEQRARFTRDMARRARLYGDAYPLDEDFLAALHHMPAASGIALGFDRLVMLATGAPRLTDIQWVPSA